MNNGYQNLSLEKIDLANGGAATDLKENLVKVLSNKIVILCDLVLNGEEKLPVVSQCNIAVSLSEEPDDWDEEQDGEFIPENIYSVMFKDVYGYDVSIVDNVITTSLSQIAIDSNITSISESVATSLIKGGTIENAKPIYIHPITINIGADNAQGARITCLIFNNDSTPFTLSTFETYMINLYNAVGETIRIMASGGGVFSASNKIVIVSFIAYTGNNKFYASGTDIETGNNVTKINGDSITDLFTGSLLSFYDGVNKIN